MTISINKNRLCGLKNIGKCDLYISSTFFGKIKPVKKWSEVKYGSGIGIKFKKNKKELIKMFFSTDWSKYSTRATNGVYHTGISHIKQLLIDKKIVKEIKCAKK